MKCYNCVTNKKIACNYIPNMLDFIQVMNRKSLNVERQFGKEEGYCTKCKFFAELNKKYERVFPFILGKLFFLSLKKGGR